MRVAARWTTLGRSPGPGVPLQLWWSTRDRIVVDQSRQSGLLYRRIAAARPRAPVRAFVGTWAHTAEMRWYRKLPFALQLFGLLSTHPAEAPGFASVAKGPDGGTLLRGVYPDPGFRYPLRRGYLYLPPRFDRSRRYPVVYLLHGLPGDPSEYVTSLDLVGVADRLIESGKARPFIAVVPAGGPSARYDGEWASPWEDYLVHGVVPWVDAHLPTDARAAGRTIAGLSAGGFGAIDIGLRSPALFGRIESWGGYFRPLHDGPFLHADARTLAANDPTLLVRREAPVLRRLGTSFYLSSGPTHSHLFKEDDTVEFGAALRRLHLPVSLHLLPTSKGQWREQFDAGLAWAVAAGS